MDEIKKILIYRTDRFGDFLISAPFIKSLKKKYPTHQIEIICSAYNQTLIENFYFINKTIVMHDGIINRLKLILKFLFKKYEIIIVLDGKRRSLFHAIWLRGKIYAVLKNNFLSFFCNFFSINYIINSESNPQLSNFQYLSNLLNFYIDDFKIFEKYKVKIKNISLPKKFILFHLDEKWFSNLYHADYTDINPDTTSVIRILNFILKKNIKIVITTGAKKLKIINNLKKIINKKKFLTKNILILEKTSFNEICFVVSKCKSLICCEGGISHLSFFFNKHTIAFYEKSRFQTYYHWTAHMKKIILYPRMKLKKIVKDPFFFNNLTKIIN